MRKMMVWRGGWYDLLATEVSTLRDLAASSGGLRKQRGGGVVLLYKDSISAKRLSFGISSTTFEVIGASMSYSSITFVVVVIYRPVGDAVFRFQCSTLS